jgi:hypothetical protein
LHVLLRGARYMLRISVTEGEGGDRWIVQGRLTRCSAYYLMAHWRAARKHRSGAQVVDLGDVTSIDRAGERVLSMMIRDGATFVNSGVYTDYLLKRLKSNS